MIKICPICGKEFKTCLSWNHTCCSRECHAILRFGKDRGKKPKDFPHNYDGNVCKKCRGGRIHLQKFKTCPNCGEMISEDFKYCSFKCQREFRKGKKVHEFYTKEQWESIKHQSSIKRKTGKKGLCDFCQKEIYIKRGNKSLHHFCNVDCYNRWKKGKNFGKDSPLFGKTFSNETKLRMSIAAKNKTVTKETRDKLRIATKESWNNSKIRENRINGKLMLSGTKFNYAYEKSKHRELKKKVGTFLEEKGYDVYYEVYVWVGTHFRIVDVVGFRNNYSEKVAVECGNVNKNKFKEYSKIFQFILHIPYKGVITYIGGLPY